MEREFSFRNYFVYLLRRWFVIVAGLIVGGAAGLVYAMIAPKPVTPEVYESSMSVSVVKYVEAKGGASINDLGDGSAGTYSAELNRIVGQAVSGKLKTATYDALKDTVYTELSEENRRKSFFDNLVVVQNGYTITAGFVYECSTEADREVAKSVAAKYIELASAEIKSIEPLLATDSTMVSVSAVMRNDDIAAGAYAEKAAAESAPGLMMTTLIGLIAGAAVGVVIGTVIYALDKRIKSVPYILDGDKAKVLSAGTETVEQAALNNLLSEVVAKDIKKLLVATPELSDRGPGFAEVFAGHLLSTGRASRFIGLNQTYKTESFDDFDGVTVYWYDEAEPGVLGYLSGRVDGTVLLVDQSKTTVKTFVTAVDSVRNDYLGVILYCVGNSYLD